MGRTRTGFGGSTDTSHFFRKKDTACTQIKTGVVAFLGGVPTLHHDAITVIILLYFENSTSNIHVNNST